MKLIFSHTLSPAFPKNLPISFLSFLPSTSIDSYYHYPYLIYIRAQTALFLLRTSPPQRINGVRLIRTPTSRARSRKSSKWLPSPLPGQSVRLESKVGPENGEV